MKSDDLKEDALKRILKEYAVAEPSDKFSEELVSMITAKYSKTVSKGQTINPWLIRSITVILIAFNIFFVYRFKLIVLYPEISFSLISFILGLAGLVAISNMLAKDKHGSIDVAA